MGNTPSVPEEAEDDNTCTVKSYQPLPESPVQNGAVVSAQSPALAGNVTPVPPLALTRVSVTAGALAAAVPAEPSRGSAASGAVPAARPRSLLPVPWAVPGRAQGPAASTAPPEPAPGASAPDTARAGGTEDPRGHKTSQALLQDSQLAGTAEGQHGDTAKDKAVTLLDRLFRLDKDKDKDKGRTRGDPEQGRQGLDAPDGSVAPDGVLLGKEIDECTQKELGQDSAGEEGPAAAPGRAQGEQDSPQAAAGQGSVMSFLKTLVSPSKAEAKSDSEDKGSKVEKGPGGQPGPKAAAESPSRGAKKKKAESPRLGHSTFSKLFRHK
ncbi:hypothetical protein Nmel_015180, partial [Mimus melanotis]